MTTTRNTAALGCLAVALLASPASFAQESGWYGGASLGRSAATIDSDRINRGLAGQGLATSALDERDNDFGYKLFGGYQLNRHFGLEASWFDLGEMGYTATTTPAGTLSGDVRLRGLGLDVVGTWPLTERFSLLGRIGMAHTQARGTFSRSGAVTLPYPSASTDESNTGVKFGAGVAWRLSPAWELRAEAERYRIKDTVGNKGDVDLFTIGLVYRFGASPAPRPVAAAYVAPVAPVIAPVAVAPPAPPAPAPVALPASILTVHFSADALFDFDRSTLRSAGARELDVFAGELRGTQYDRIAVTGHTDRIGSDSYNAKLSQRRAEAVSAYLVQAGVPAGKLASSGAGEGSPVTTPGQCRGTVATPSLVACLQADRRVEVEVTGQRQP